LQSVTTVVSPRRRMDGRCPAHDRAPALRRAPPSIAPPRRPSLNRQRPVDGQSC